MRLLLDTHIWLWQLLDNRRLSHTASKALEETTHELFLSPISVWECLILASKRKLSLDPDPIRWVEEALNISPTTMLPLNHDIAIESARLPNFDHPDPADRFLIATSRVHDLTLVTADNVLRRYRHVKTLW